MAQVVLENVSKWFAVGRDKVQALCDLTLSAAPGELLVLVGPSGCGKTTTLRLIAGLESPSAGRIFIDGADATGLPPARRDVAMVFQSAALFPHLTVFENIALGLRLRGVARREIDSAVVEAAEALGIDSLLDRLPGELSGGQAQRVALGRAMVRQPKVFLFDEPLSNLDPALRVQMRTELLRLHRRLGATMIYVTHDQSEAMTLGQRVAVLRGGVLQQAATPRCVYHQPFNRFVAGFLGSPPMNFFRGKIISRDGGLIFKAEGLSSGDAAGEIRLPRETASGLATFSGSELWLGLRPEALFIGEPPDGREAWVPLSAEVEFLEHTGADAFAHLCCGQTLCAARCEAATSDLSPRQVVTVWLNLSRATFFDAATEQRLVLKR
jgi:multiple sugar transport system ATP-binding protein